MNSPPLNPESASSIEIKWSDRWFVYHRLQELDVSCHCGTNEPLQVALSHPLAAIQLWSVVKHTTSSRPVLVQWLNHCWQINIANDYQ